MKIMRKNNKKVLLILLFIMFFSLPSDNLIHPAEDAQLPLAPIVFGDVNGNGGVDVVDAIMILRHIVGLANLGDITRDDYDEMALIRANIQGKYQGGQPGPLQVDDAIRILRKIVGIETSFPMDNALIWVQKFADSTVPKKTPRNSLSALFPAEIVAVANNAPDTPLSLPVNWLETGAPYNENEANRYLFYYDIVQPTAQTDYRVDLNLLRLLGFSNLKQVEVADFQIKAASCQLTDDSYSGILFNNNVDIFLTEADEAFCFREFTLYVTLPGTLHIIEIVPGTESILDEDTILDFIDENPVPWHLNQGENIFYLSEIIAAYNFPEEDIDLAYARALLGEEVIINGSVSYLLGDGSQLTTPVSIKIVFYEKEPAEEE